MKILLIGERYSANLGDGIICETVESLLRNHYKKSEVIMADISGKLVINYIRKRMKNNGENDKKIIKSNIYIKSRYY